MLAEASLRFGVLEAAPSAKFFMSFSATARSSDRI